MPTLQEQFGNIDIYLFDQLLRGNLRPQMRILDAGCGGGRNLTYLLQNGYTVYGLDPDPAAIAHVRQMALQTGHISPDNFVVASMEHMPFPDQSFDAVLCSAVLHFARSKEQFREMLHEAWRVLRTDGLFFCRLGSRIGKDFPKAEGDLYQLPGGQRWFLVDEDLLLQMTAELGGELVDPLKTTVIQDSRCMTTWVAKKR